MNEEQTKIHASFRQGCKAAPQGPDALVAVNPGQVLALCDAIDTLTSANTALGNQVTALTSQLAAANAEIERLKQPDA